MRIRVMGSLWVLPPPVPVTVRVKLPVGPVRWAVMVKLDVPVPPAPRGTGLGLNAWLVLLGRPLTLRLTLPVKSLSEVRVTV